MLKAWLNCRARNCMDLISPISLAFYSVVIATFLSACFIIARAHHGTGKAARPLFWFSLISIMWLSLSAFTAHRHWLLDGTFPQYLILLGVAIPGLFSIISIVALRKTITVLPGKWLSFFQILRVPLEAVFYALFLQHVYPEELTITGRNPELALGLLAPVISMLYYSNHSIGKFYAILWNLLGLGSLFLVLGLGFTALPSSGEGELHLLNPLWFEYPWIWHLSYLIPLFMYGHIVSLFQLFQKNPSSCSLRVKKEGPLFRWSPYSLYGDSWRF